MEEPKVPDFYQGQAEKLPEAEFERFLSERVDVKSLSQELHEPLSHEIVINSLASLVYKLGPEIDNYDTIISDDASGRLTSLLLREIANNRRDAAGREEIQTIFLSGGKYLRRLSVTSQHGVVSVQDKAEALKKYLEKRSECLDRILLVTEFITTGRGIEVLVDIMEDLNLSFELAAVSICDPPEEYSPSLTKRLVFGSIGSAGDYIWDNKESAGVIKNPDVDPIHPSRRPKKESSATKNAFNSTAVRNSRKDIKALASALEILIPEKVDQ